MLDNTGNIYSDNNPAFSVYIWRIYHRNKCLPGLLKINMVARKKTITKYLHKKKLSMCAQSTAPQLSKTSFEVMKQKVPF